MSAKDKKSNSKENLLKLKAPLLISPFSQKKNSKKINLYTEPKIIFQKTENILNKNLYKQKKDEKNFFSHKKENSKLFLKKNMTQDLADLNFTEGNIVKPDDKILKNRLNNIKFNIGKSSQNFLGSKISTTNLKKNAESAYELIDNNYLKKSKNKSKKIIKLNNIDSFGMLYASNKDKNEQPIAPPKLELPQKMIFVNNEENKDQIHINENTTEDNDKKEQINCVMRNTFTNVKIYPTTFLNNKIIYQNVEKNNNEHNDKSETSNNSSTMRHNNSKIKKEKIVIDIADKKPKKEDEDYGSIEELHFLFVDTLQKGKIFAIKLDKMNN